MQTRYKNGQKECDLSHVTYFSNCWTPNISGMGEVTNLKFARGLKVWGRIQNKNAKLVTTSRDLDHVPQTGPVTF